MSFIAAAAPPDGLPVATTASQVAEAPAAPPGGLPVARTPPPVAEAPPGGLPVATRAPVAADVRAPSGDERFPVGCRVGVWTRCAHPSYYRRHMGFATVCPRHPWARTGKVTVRLDGDDDTRDVDPEQLGPVEDPSLDAKVREWMETVGEDLGRELEVRGESPAGRHFLCEDPSLAGFSFSWVVPYDSDEAPWRGQVVRDREGNPTLVWAYYRSHTCASNGITLHAVRCGGQPTRARRRRRRRAGAGAGAGAAVV